LFSQAKGPRVALSLLSQSESKCLVHSEEGHLIVIGQNYSGLHGAQHDGAQFKKALHCLIPTHIMSRRKWTYDVLHRLHRLFDKNAITRSGNVENIWHACEPPSLDYFEETKRP
jgi:hypothetical protein